MFLAYGALASAQELSLAVSLDASSYKGDAYQTTDGDRGVEVAIGYETLRGLRFSGGVFVGKFDEPISDPSFTAVSLFFETVVDIPPDGSCPAVRRRTCRMGTPACRRSCGRLVGVRLGSGRGRGSAGQARRTGVRRCANRRVGIEHAAGRWHIAERHARSDRRNVLPDLGPALTRGHVASLTFQFDTAFTIHCLTPS